MANRWDELERLGNLRADGLVSDEEFETQKRRILEADGAATPEPTVKPVVVEEPIKDWRAWSKIAFIVAVAGVLLALLIWVFSPSPSRC